MTISPAMPPAATPTPAAAPAAPAKGGEGMLPGFAEALMSLGLGDAAAPRKGKVEGKVPIKDEQRALSGYAIAVPVYEQPLPPVAPLPDLQSLGLQALAARADAPGLPAPALPQTAQAPPPPPAPRKADTPPAPKPASSGARADLTFAARVQPGDQPKKASGAVQAINPVAPKKVIESDTQDTPADAGQNAAGQNAAAGKAFAAFESSGRLNPPPPDAPSTPSKPVEAAVPVAPAPPTKPAAQPLKDLSLEMSQPGAQKVEVRLVQQSGEVHVAVRTGDSDLAHGLRQNLPELVGHLEDNGFHAEAWRPSVAAVAGPGHVLETRSAGSDQSQTPGDGQSRSGSQQQQGQQSRQHSNRPAWVEELESSTGEIYGFGN